MNTYIIGCTHFYHTNIIKYCRSNKFEYSQNGMEKMNALLVKNWNKIVSDKDTVIHLGDFCFKISITSARDMFNSLNGKKLIVMGNHDGSISRLYDMGFISVLDECVIRYKGKRILCTHRPQDTLRPDIDGVFHAHIHNSSESDRISAGETGPIAPFNVNLSTEVINYKPVDVSAAFGMLKRQTKGTKFHVT